ncbi:MAG: hypothetical protein E6Q34_03595 [Burkholderiaceae bacterium]|nr:MAG: hypothetical protein E6Q34_03595 [Burkholderiaceae bacterium]
MTAHATHAIHALQIDLAIEGTSETLSRENSQYADWVRDYLVPIIAEVIEQEAAQAGLGQHRHRRIAKLELDLGEIESDIVNEEIGRRLRAQLHAALHEQLAQGDTRQLKQFEAEEGKLADTTSTSGTELELQTAALQEFLRTGNLEWAYAKNPRYAHKRLLQQSLIQHQNQPLLQEILTQPRHLLRLIRQFDTADLMQIARQRFARWSTNERNRVLDWLSFELSQHSLNRDYCENLWLFALHGAWQGDAKHDSAVKFEPQDSLQLVRHFYLSQDLHLRHHGQRAQEELTRLAQALGVQAETLDDLRQMFAQLGDSAQSDEPTLTSSADQDTSTFSKNNEYTQLEKPSGTSLETLLQLLAQADYDALQTYWPTLLRDAPQHLENLHAQHANAWRASFPLQAKRDLLDLFQLNLVWLLDALQSFSQEAAAPEIYSHAVDFALLQTPHSLTSADLIQTLESQFGQQLSVWTPQAKQLKALTALPAEQSYQVALEGLNAASSTTHPGWNLHELGRYWSDAQWLQLLSKYDSAQLRNLVKASYAKRGMNADFAVALIDSTTVNSTGNAATASLQTLWRLIRVAMDVRYTFGSQNLADEVAMVLLQINARHHSGDEVDLLAQVFANLRHKQILSNATVSNLRTVSGPENSPLAIALKAWMDSDGHPKWRKALEALVQAKIGDHPHDENGPTQKIADITLAPKLDGAWLLQKPVKDATWLEHLFKHPQVAIQTYRNWDQQRRQQMITELDPAMQEHLMMALHAPQASLIKELLGQLETLKTFFGKAFGNNFVASWNLTQLRREMQQALLGVSTLSANRRAFELSASSNLEVARTAIVDTLLNSAAELSSRPVPQWRTALTNLMVSADTSDTRGSSVKPEQAQGLSDFEEHAVKFVPHSLQLEARERLPILSRLLQSDIDQRLLLKQSEAVKRTTELTVTNSKDSNSVVQLHELWQALLDSSGAGSSPMQRLSQNTRDKLLQLYRQVTQKTPSLQGELQTLFERILDTSKAADSTSYDNTKFDLATEALQWRANQALHGADNNEQTTPMTSSAGLEERWQSIDLQDLGRLRDLIDKITLDIEGIKVVEQELNRLHESIEHKAARELAMLLGLPPAIPRERMLTAMIQVSSVHANLAPMTYYQSLLNRWFQSLGQAEVALPFLRCVEFYASKLEPAAAQSYFLKAVLRELLAQRDIDIELLLEQAHEQYPNAQANSVAISVSSTLFGSADDRASVPDSVPLSDDFQGLSKLGGLNAVGAHRLPVAVSQLQSIIASPASEALQATISLESYAWIRRPDLRAWLSHYFSETVLRATQVELSTSSKENTQSHSRWRPQLRRSITQAQDHHLLLLLGAAISVYQAAKETAIASPEIDLAEILCEEFSIPTADLNELVRLGNSLDQETWRHFLGVSSGDHERFSSHEGMQSSRLEALGRQLFSFSERSGLGSKAQASRPIDKSSPLPRSWQEHLPQILADAFLSASLRKLDTVWNELLSHHSADLVRAQSQYLRLPSHRNALIAQNPSDKIRELMQLNAPRLALLSDALDLHAESLHQLWRLPMSLQEWRSHLRQQAYHASFNKEVIKQSQAKQLEFLLRSHATWPRELSTEQHLFAQGLYTLLQATQGRIDHLIEALTQSLADQERRRIFALDQASTSDNTSILQDGQSLIDDDALHRNLFESLKHDLDVANTLQSLQQYAAPSSMVSRLSERLWSSPLIYQNSGLWKRLSQELRAQSRTLHPEELKRAAFDFEQIDQALARLIDPDVIHSLAQAIPSTTSAAAEVSEMTGKRTEQLEHNTLIVLLQSLNALNHNESQWARSLVRRLLLRHASAHATPSSDETLAKLRDVLRSDLIANRWCDLLEPIELEQFFSVHHATLVTQLRRLLPIAAAYAPNMLDGDGRFWSKKALRAFYQLGFVKQSSTLEDYLAALGLLAQHDTSPEQVSSNASQTSESSKAKQVAEHFERVKAELKQQEVLRLEQERRQQEQRKKSADELKKRARLLGEEDEIPYGESNVHNAGMVIIAPYIQRLFSILELTKNNAFVDDNAAQRAVHLLQYVVTGETSTPEYQLALNKLLCGIHGGLPIVAGIDLSEHEKTVVEQMLNGVISHWSALGKTSIAGLRQTFLVREGQLRYDEESWQLRIPTSTFDMLLDRLPWSFSMIRLPWMRAPLHVKWRANS